MGRRVRDARLDNASQRSKLAVQSEPYWRLVSEGCHIGYYKGSRGGKWVARYRKPGTAGGYAKTTLGEADDIRDADGRSVLDWKQADAAARAWFAQCETGRPKAGPYTVGQALDDYIAQFTKKSLAGTKLRIEALIRPDLGHVDLASLTSRQISDWLHKRAATPARLRTSVRAKEQNARPLETDEEKRRRQSTANRDFTVLKAALNLAFRDGHVTSDAAWRKVRPFQRVDRPKLRYLDDDEARRLVNASPGELRPLVQAALLTGARYAELAAIKVRDVNLSAGTVWLPITKSGSGRAVYLEQEGRALFEASVAGKTGDDLVFPRANGRAWKHAEQARPMREACRMGKIDPPVSFHDLRRTYGARLALAGIPMAVIAEALGHADERITRRHYAHLSPSYVADRIRAGAAGLGIVQEETKVVAIGDRRNSPG